MKFEQLTINERTHVKKNIKETLILTQQKVKVGVNPNEFDYSYKKGALLTQGRLLNMDDKQIKASVIRNIKSWLSKVVA